MAASGAVHIIVPTYRRDADLVALLEQFPAQSLPPTSVYVVDNASSTKTRRTCEDTAARQPGFEVHYLDAGDNLGPAGSTALGMGVILDVAGDDDWIVRADDDSILRRDDLFAGLVEAGTELRAADDRFGGIGTHGACFDIRRFRLQKPPRGAAGSSQPVDYLATNHFPFFSVRVVREAGVFRSDLFFGHTEVEYGLRLRRRGWKLYTTVLPPDRAGAEAKQSLSRRGPRLTLEPVTWRRYYSARNMIVIAIEYGSRRRAIWLVVSRLIGKPLLHLPRHPTLASANIKLGIIAARDAFAGRLGRTVEPTMRDGRLDTRGAELRGGGRGGAASRS